MDQAITAEQIDYNVDEWMRSRFTLSDRFMATDPIPKLQAERL
jgi:hypothetical protein